MDKIKDLFKDKRVRVIGLFVIIVVIFIVLIKHDNKTINNTNNTENVSIDDTTATTNSDETTENNNQGSVDYETGSYDYDDGSTNNEPTRVVVTYDYIIEKVTTSASNGWLGFNTDLGILNISRRLMSDKCGYQVVDVNGDGVDELVIGSMTTDIVYNMFTKYNDNVVCVFSANSLTDYRIAHDKIEKDGIVYYFKNGSYSVNFDEGVDTTISEYNTFEYTEIEANENAIPVIDSSVWTNDMYTTHMNNCSEEAAFLVDITEVSYKNGSPMINTSMSSLVYNGPAKNISYEILTNDCVKVYSDETLIAVIGIYSEDSVKDLYDAVVEAGCSYDGITKGIISLGMSDDGKTKFLVSNSYVYVVTTVNSDSAMCYEFK